MSGFYRIDKDGALLHAPNGLATPTGSYVSSNHNAYVYPIDGAWRWFDDEAAALVFFAGAQTPPLTPVQVRIALRQAGITSAMVDAVIAAISDPVERDIAATYWEYATQIHRDHPLIASFTTGLGLTSEQVDTMWQAAAGIT